MSRPAKLDHAAFQKLGAQHFHAAVLDDLDILSTILANLPSDRAGVRLRGIDRLGRYLATGGRIGAVAAEVLGDASRPVRAILFDKTADTNWSLDWHQDRTICVEQRVDVDGYGPWSMKAGMQHVAPPFDLLSRMVTVRVHLDDVSVENAPLLIAPGSHRYGRVAIDHVPEVVRQCGVQVCLAKAGDIWLYATPILHASDAAARPMRRRVLQIDYAAEDLPGDLEWLGV
jgi:ectoine hydroxylase-related dioxygenase (phytanoyl-CoA dioxygenase family)